MSPGIALTLLLAISPVQAEEVPAYAREADRVEQEFRGYRDRLNAFFASLRGAIAQQSPAAAATLPPLQQQDAPPASAGRIGYGMLPRFVEGLTAASTPVSTFSYSWPITVGYIAGENVKLSQVEADLSNLASAPSDDKTGMIANLIREYRKLAANQRTIDQYIQYNHFWQRSIAQDRPRFDQLNQVYELMKSDEPDMGQAIRQVLGRPEVPAFARVDRTQPDIIIVRVPVYTDIEDDRFLEKAKAAIEESWQAEDDEGAYRLEIDLRRVPPNGNRGDRIDVRAHAARFPQDGAVLTTGAETTHSLVGRYVALGPGDLSARTLAHEFGHVLGFRDGYLRGYRDLGEQGFEILELTSVFDDIMSAPREGRVRPAHFRLILERN
jgi:hypothetical protein